MVSGMMNSRMKMRLETLPELGDSPRLRRVGLEVKANPV